MKFCTKCGADLSGSKNFCPNCGYDLRTVESKNNDSVDIEYIGNQDEDVPQKNNSSNKSKTLTNQGTLVLDKNDIQSALDNKNDYMEKEYQFEDENIDNSTSDNNSNEPYIEEVYDDGYIDDGYYENNEYYDDEYYDEPTNDNEYYDDSSNSNYSKNNNTLKNNLNKVDFLKDKKNQLIIGIIVGILVIFGISTFTYGKINSPEKVVSKFEKAIDNNDSKSLAKIADCYDENLEINEESLQPFIDYCSSNPEYASNIKDNLKSQIKNPSSLKDASSQSDAIALAETGGIFNKAVISIKPMTMTVKSDAKGASVSISGKDYGTINEVDKEVQISPIVPGKHKITASFNSDFANVTEDSEVDIITDDSDTVSLFTKYKAVQIKGNDTNAIVFLDGKSTGMTIKDATNFFPVTESSELYAEIEKDGKTLQSPKVKVKKQKYIQLNVNGKASSNSDDETSESGADPIMNKTIAEQKLKELIKMFVEKIPTAVSANDPSLLWDYITKDGDVNKEIKSLIKKYSKDNNTLSYQNHSFSFNFNPDLASGTVNLKTTYLIIDKDGKRETKNINNTYSFEYDESSQNYKFTDIE